MDRKPLECLDKRYFYFYFILFYFTLPVYRVFLCKRCRIRTRDHGLCNTTSEPPQKETLNSKKFEVCIKRLVFWCWVQRCRAKD